MKSLPALGILRARRIAPSTPRIHHLGKPVIKPIRSAYIAPVGLEKQLRAEIPSQIGEIERLVVSSEQPHDILWAQNIWQNPVVVPIHSIKDAVKKLKELGPLWCPYYARHPRRAKLIQAALPYFSGKRLEFLQRVASTKLGSWTMLDRDTILASPTCSSVRPNGEWEFVEDKEGPPSRAYLKLWELFTRFGFRPNQQDVCLELGAAPGGWTWVLAPLALKVIAYDRAPLAEPIRQLPNVESHQGNAFSITPSSHPEVDWVFSDVICEPKKLYNWLLPWLSDAKPRSFCLTVKLKGDDYQEWLTKFRCIPGSSLTHLYHNKHELTFVLLHGNSSEALGSCGRPCGRGHVKMFSLPFKSVHLASNLGPSMKDMWSCASWERAEEPRLSTDSFWGFHCQ